MIVFKGLFHPFFLLRKGPLLLATAGALLRSTMAGTFSFFLVSSFCFLFFLCMPILVTYYTQWLVLLLAGTDGLPRKLVRRGFILLKHDDHDQNSGDGNDYFRTQPSFRSRDHN